jgi:hypothetical protein
VSSTQQAWSKGRYQGRHRQTQQADGKAGSSFTHRNSSSSRSSRSSDRRPDSSLRASQPHRPWNIYWTWCSSQQLAWTTSTSVQPTRAPKG